jgi:hypothetical protein
VTIILGGDFLNKIFFPKKQDTINLFFFHNSREFLELLECQVRQNITKFSQKKDFAAAACSKRPNTGGG